MSNNRPPVYGFCPAGCKWETVHKEDWVNSAAFIEIADNNTAGHFNLELGKKYKIVKQSSNATITYSYPDESYNPVSITIATLTFPVFNYAEFILAKVEVSGANIVFTYELDGVVDTYTTTYTAGDWQDALIEVSTVAHVYKVNDGETVVSPYKVFIKYAEDENGTNMSDTWTSSKPYIGFYVGMETSTTASDYEWSLFIAYENKSDSITILTSNWTSNSYTYATGLTLGENDVLIVSPKLKADSVIWANSGVFARISGNNIIFDCDTTPTSSLNVEIAIIKGGAN